MIVNDANKSTTRHVPVWIIFRTWEKKDDKWNLEMKYRNYNNFWEEMWFGRCVKAIKLLSLLGFPEVAFRNKVKEKRKSGPNITAKICELYTSSFKLTYEYKNCCETHFSNQSHFPDMWNSRFNQNGSVKQSGSEGEPGAPGIQFPLKVEAVRWDPRMILGQALNIPKKMQQPLWKTCSNIWENVLAPFSSCLPIRQLKGTS